MSKAVELGINRKTTETIQDLKVNKIIAPSDKYKNEYNVIITYDNTIYTNNLNEVLFESKFFGWDMFETLLLNGIINGTVGDIDCLTECKVIKEQKVLKITLTLTLDKKPMKTIQEQFYFKLNEKILEFDDKIALSICNLKDEINLAVLYPQAEIKNYYINGCHNSIKLENLTINGKSCPDYFGIQVINLLTKEVIIWMPMINEATPNNFNTTILKPNETYYFKDIKQTFINVECDLIINALVEEEDRQQFQNYKTDFQTYINLWKYLESNQYIMLKRDTNNKIVDYSNVGISSNHLYYELCSILITESHVNINYIKLFENKLVLFTNPNRQIYKRNITIYHTLDEFLEDRDQFKTYQIIDYNDKYIIVETLIR
jgi:hypothetical protein